MVETSPVLSSALIRLLGLGLSYVFSSTFYVDPVSVYLCTV